MTEFRVQVDADTSYRHCVTSHLCMHLQISHVLRYLGRQLPILVLRQASIGMYVTNLPYVWSLIRQPFRIPDDTNVYQSNDKHSKPYSRSKGRSADAEHQLSDLDTVNDRTTGLARSESEENIVETKTGPGTVGPSDYDVPGWE